MRNRRLGRAAAAVTAVLSAAALVRELRMPRGRRRWHGRILGVPYDFRVPTLARARRRWWNPGDARLVVPKLFGVGWDLNLGRIWRLLRRR